MQPKTVKQSVCGVRWCYEKRILRLAFFSANCFTISDKSKFLARSFSMLPFPTYHGPERPRAQAIFQRSFREKQSFQQKKNLIFEHATDGGAFQLVFNVGKWPLLAGNLTRFFFFFSFLSFSFPFFLFPSSFFWSPVSTRTSPVPRTRQTPRLGYFTALLSRKIGRFNQKCHI